MSDHEEKDIELEEVQSATQVSDLANANEYPQVLNPYENDENNENNENIKNNDEPKPNEAINDAAPPPPLYQMDSKVAEEMYNDNIALMAQQQAVTAPGNNGERGQSLYTKNNTNYGGPGNSVPLQTHSCIDELQGKYLELDVEGETVYCQIKGITSTMKSHDAIIDQMRLTQATATATQATHVLTKKEKKEIKVSTLIRESTNQWLYTNDIMYDGEAACGEKCNRCTNGCMNKFIAVAVILIQCMAYIAMTIFLVSSVQRFQSNREEACYGPNCVTDIYGRDKPCIELKTGALISILLVGFLWADVINIFSVCKYNCLASLLCLTELLIAIICGFIIGLYTDSDFDAISGAIGILFVHDLDERVYASMQIISRRKKSASLKKLLAVFLWIFVSLAISFIVACKFEGGGYFATGGCLISQYQCGGAGECVWAGFVCNGVKDCIDGSDEGDDAGCLPYSDEYCPIDTFMCIETGECLPTSKKCNGILDCEDGSDEARDQDCAAFVLSQKCEQALTITYPEVATTGETFHQKWTGNFKCNNGQCINASYACDGIKGDCVDGSDEYPFFDQADNYMVGFLSACPYSQLITCGSAEVLCKVDGQCISKGDICDGVEQCSDGADEKGCEYKCNVQAIAEGITFQCSGSVAYVNGTHIVLFSGDVISYNDNDERDTLINQNTYLDTGKCITNEWRCDGLQDCDDGSDELECSVIPCEENQYKCPSSGECITIEWLCDYVDDCPDGSDEDEDKVCSLYDRAFSDGSYCSTHLGDGYFGCPADSEICIYKTSFCDGYCDCTDDNDCGDEDPVVCGSYGLTPSPNYQTNTQFTTTTGTNTAPTDPPNVPTTTGNNNAPTVSTTAAPEIWINCGGEPLFGQIASIGQRVRYSFVLPQGGNISSVTFSTCNDITQSDDFDTAIYLYDDANNLIASNDDNGCAVSGLASILYYDNSDPSWSPGSIYRIDVGRYGDSGTGVYGISVSDCT